MWQQLPRSCFTKCFDKGAFSLDILYADNHVVVVKKPSGIPTQSEDGPSVEKEARLWAKQYFSKPGEVFLYAVHRLDKPVSGILLLAKTSKALERLHRFFREKRMKKTYRALVEGVLMQEEGVLEDYLRQEEFRAVLSSSADPKAKLCRLSYKVLERCPFATLVEIDLDTGRYHQIRAQFSHLGHPIVGDLKYGASYMGNQRIALHHQKMEFPHPITKELLLFEAAPPRSWNEWIEELALFVPEAPRFVRH